jgi:hypothetical protein
LLRRAGFGVARRRFILRLALVDDEAVPTTRAVDGIDLAASAGDDLNDRENLVLLGRLLGTRACRRKHAPDERLEPS